MTVKPAAWIVPLFLLSLLAGCGRESGSGKTESPMSSEVAGEKFGETPSFDQRALTVFESYLRLKNGVASSENVEVKKERLNRFALSMGSVREAGHAIAARSSANCRRFIGVYNDLGSQVSYYSGRLIDPDQPLDEISRRHIENRLHILHFFSRALFGLILLKAEAGQSSLDPNLHFMCSPLDRPTWAGLLFKAQVDLENLIEGVVGVPKSLESSADQTSRTDEVTVREGRNKIFKQASWIIGEIAASIYIWEKFVSPNLGARIFDIAVMTPAGRVGFIAANCLYVIAWVAFDRFWRERLPFLQSPPDVVSISSVSSWENLMNASERFLASGQDSEPLYTAYEKLLRSLRREQALEFVETHRDLLGEAEREYGSIENANEKLKEALRHENAKNDNRDSDYKSDRAGGIRAAN